MNKLLFLMILQNASEDAAGLRYITSALGVLRTNNDIDQSTYENSLHIISNYSYYEATPNLKDQIRKAIFNGK